MVKYTIRSIVCEASCLPDIWVIRVIQVIRVIWVIWVIMSNKVIIPLFSTLRLTYNFRISRSASQTIIIFFIPLFPFQGSVCLCQSCQNDIESIKGRRQKRPCNLVLLLVGGYYIILLWCCVFRSVLVVAE